MQFSRGQVLFIKGGDPISNEGVCNAIACGRFEPIPVGPLEALGLVDSVDFILMDASVSTGENDENDPLTLLSHLWCARPDLPAVLLSDGDPGLEERALRAGVTCVLTTPFTETELRAALHTAQQQRNSGIHFFTQELARTMSVVASVMDENEEPLQKALEEVSNLFRVGRSSIFLFDAPETFPLKMAAFVGFDPEVAKTIRIGEGEGIAGKVGKEGIPQLILRKQKKDQDPIKQLTAAVSVPIRAAGANTGGIGQILGVLNLAKNEQGDVFTPRDLEICEFMAAHIGQWLSRRALDAQQAKLNHQVVAVEKLSYAGELAAGIAHEVASPIAFVSANMRTLKEYFEDLAPLIDVLKEAAEEGKENISLKGLIDDADDFVDIMEDLPTLVDECVDGMNRATQIVNDMKAMVRISDTEEVWTPVDVPKLISSSLRLLRPRLADRCKVTTEPFEDIVVQGREVELSQVIVNLVVNASDACVERKESEGEESPYAAMVTVKAVSVVENDIPGCLICVSDNGVGIPKEKVSQIFAPLFTTKAAGGGTGLGLGIVQRIMGAHYGKIRVDSDLGVGTTFSLFLPSHPPAENDDEDAEVASEDKQAS
ncbi:MAG: GAF domain-containing protein [Deltaproteobacteria bacterium]|nr:GAF domain-containing protein [Deltaproteobacteria bacterium]